MIYIDIKNYKIKQNVILYFKTNCYIIRLSQEKRRIFMFGLRKIKGMKEKGITLVALVITIVILLILAGISISTLTNTGIFQKAKEA